MRLTRSPPDYNWATTHIASLPTGNSGECPHHSLSLSLRAAAATPSSVAAAVALLLRLMSTDLAGSAPCQGIDIVLSIVGPRLPSKSLCPGPPSVPMPFIRCRWGGGFVVLPPGTWRVPGFLVLPKTQALSF
jgi:hypothetical protein